MEFVTLENSSLTDEDFILTDIKQEAVDEVWDLDSVVHLHQFFYPVAGNFVVDPGFT